MKIASYLECNPLIQEFADWAKDELGRDDFYLGAYVDGSLFIVIEGVEISYLSALRFMKNKQLRFNF